MGILLSIGLSFFQMASNIETPGEVRDEKKETARSTAKSSQRHFITTIFSPITEMLLEETKKLAVVNERKKTNEEVQKVLSRVKERSTVDHEILEEFCKYSPHEHRSVFRSLYRRSVGLFRDLEIYAVAIVMISTPGFDFKSENYSEIKDDDVLKLWTFTERLGQESELGSLYRQHTGSRTSRDFNSEILPKRKENEYLVKYLESFIDEIPDVLEQIEETGIFTNVLQTIE